MSVCGYEQYSLPTLDFVGGSWQDLEYNVYFRSLANPFDLSKCSANFAIIDVMNSHRKPILSKDMTIEQGSASVAGKYISNKLRVQLMSSETVELSGKYIYQISIKEGDDKTEIPKQGLLYITNNINRPFISG